MMHDSQDSHTRQTPWFSAQKLENIYENKFQIFVIATIEWDSSFQTTDKAIALPDYYFGMNKMSENNSLYAPVHVP